MSIRGLENICDVELNGLVLKHPRLADTNYLVENEIATGPEIARLLKYITKKELFNDLNRNWQIVDRKNNVIGQLYIYSHLDRETMYDFNPSSSSVECEIIIYIKNESIKDKQLDSIIRLFTRTLFDKTSLNTIIINVRENNKDFRLMIEKAGYTWRTGMDGLIRYFCTSYYQKQLPFISRNDDGYYMKYFDESEFNQVPVESPAYEQLKEYYESRKTWIVAERNGNIVGFIGLDRKGESGIFIHPIVRPTEDMLVYVLELFSRALLETNALEDVSIFVDRLTGYCNDPWDILEKAGFHLTGSPMGMRFQIGDKIESSGPIYNRRKGDLNYY